MASPPTGPRKDHAMCWPDENDETTSLLRDDPECQIVIATIAFGQGFNVKPALDSIQLGVAISVNQTEQQRGHVGRDLSVPARGVIFVQPSAMAAAEKYLKG
jgi:superfamily II DNA helicase RecQ